MPLVVVSYECVRLCAHGNVVATGESVMGAGISLGGVHGIECLYTSLDMLSSNCGVFMLSTPMKASPEDADWLRLRAASRLVGVVVQPVSSL